MRRKTKLRCPASRHRRDEMVAMTTRAWDEIDEGRGRGVQSTQRIPARVQFNPHHVWVDCGREGDYHCFGGACALHHRGSQNLEDQSLHQHQRENLKSHTNGLFLLRLQVDIWCYLHLKGDTLQAMTLKNSLIIDFSSVGLTYDRTKFISEIQNTSVDLK